MNTKLYMPHTVIDQYLQQCSPEKCLFKLDTVSEVVLDATGCRLAASTAAPELIGRPPINHRIGSLIK